MPWKGYNLRMRLYEKRRTYLFYLSRPEWHSGRTPQIGNQRAGKHINKRFKQRRENLVHIRNGIYEARGDSLPENYSGESDPTWKIGTASHQMFYDVKELH
jgi:hypothetical protein